MAERRANLRASDDPPLSRNLSGQFQHHPSADQRLQSDLVPLHRFPRRRKHPFRPQPTRLLLPVAARLSHPRASDRPLPRLRRPALHRRRSSQPVLVPTQPPSPLSARRVRRFRPFRDTRSVEEDTRQSVAICPDNAPRRRARRGGDQAMAGRSESNGEQGAVAHRSTGIGRLQHTSVREDGFR